jgi:hypothetical protein
VVRNVGGANGEIARRRGIEPKKPNIEPRGHDIVQGWKRLAAWVERPHVMRGVWCSKVWEGCLTRSRRGGGLNPKKRISSHVGSISSRGENGLRRG